MTEEETKRSPVRKRKRDTPNQKMPPEFEPLLAKGFTFYPLMKQEKLVEGDHLILVGDFLRVSGTSCIVIGDNLILTTEGHYFAGREVRKGRGSYFEVELDETKETKAQLSHIVTSIIKRLEGPPLVQPKAVTEPIKPDRRGLDRIRTMQQPKEPALCCVCVEDLACVVSVDCGHVPFCRQCALTAASNKQLVCPYCRKLFKFSPLYFNNS